MNFKYESRKNFSKSILFSIITTLVLLGYPFISFFPAYYHLETRLFSIPLRLIILTLSTLNIILYGSINNINFYTSKSKKIGSNIFYLVLLFWLLYIIKILIIVPYYNATSYLSNEEYLQTVFGMTLVPTISLMLTRFDDIDINLLKSILGPMCLLTGILLIFSIISSENTLEFYDSGRMYTEAISPIFIGFVGSWNIVSGIFLYKPNIGVKKKLFLLLSIIVGVILISLSGSRSPVVGLLALFIVYNYKSFFSSYIKLIIIIVMSYLFLIIINVTIDYLNPEFYNRFLLIFSEEIYDSGSDSRVGLATNALSQFYDNFIFGSRLTEKNTGYYPHNMFIESFMALGVFGGVLFTIIQLKILIIIYMSLMARKNNIFFSALSIVIYFSYLFTGSIYSSPEYWFTILLFLKVYFMDSKYNQIAI